LRELTVIDLFAGIGGFSYGMHNASPRFKTIAFAEIDEFCRKVLRKNFGNVKIYEDVRDVRIEQPVFLVCGGFPCQGFSVAGLQRGTKDNRYLWPEMFDVIKHAKPRWVIAENVRGIVNVEDGVAFNKVHTDLESQGYEVQAFNIPASAKGAWHRRERIWFVACNPDVVYPHDFRCEQHTEAEEKGNGRAEATSFSGSSHASDSGSKRLKSSRATGKMGSKSKEEEGRRNQSSFLSTSSSNVPDSESERTGEPGEPHKEKRLEGGNAAQSNGGGAVDVPDSKDKRREQTQWQRGESSGRGSNDTRGFERKRKNFESDVPDSNEGNAQAGRERQRGVCEKDKVKGQPDNAARPRQALPDSESIGHGGGSGEERGTEQRKFQQKEQTRNEMGSETEGCGELSGGERNVPDSDTGLGVRENEEIQAGGNSTVNGSEDVSDSNGEGLEGHDEHRSSKSIEREKKSHIGAGNSSTKIEDDANTKSIGYADTSYEEKREGSAARCGKGEFERSGIEEECQGDWSEIIAQFRGIPDGVSTAVDRNRTPRLKSLGNAIVPQIAETIGRAIIKAESRQ
jgi:DNA (cytosine-5)-methyltransferase 1